MNVSTQASIFHINHRLIITITSISSTDIHRLAITTHHHHHHIIIIITTTITTTTATYQRIFLPHQWIFSDLLDPTLSHYSVRCSQHRITVGVITKQLSWPSILCHHHHHHHLHPHWNRSIRLHCNPLGVAASCSTLSTTIRLQMQSQVIAMIMMMMMMMVMIDD